MKHILFTLLLLSSLTIYAQDEVDSWYLNERPEHVYQYAEGGIRRLPFKVGTRESAALTCSGSPRVPVVLVQFADRPFHAAGNTDEEIIHSFDLFFNSKDTAEVQSRTGSKGSVSQYFSDQSLGVFTPQFDIIGPITLDNNYSYYGRGKRTDSNISAFYRESMTKCVKDFQVDWSHFDNDNNGKVDMVFFIHAGWGENTVSEFDPDAIWAKESTSAFSVTDNYGTTVTFSCYGVCSEARYKNKGQLMEDVKEGSPFYPTGYNPQNLKMDGIGVCIHELSHALGLPDFYDTRNVAFGMDVWSVMDYGEYGANGYNPGNYTAYERDFMNWQPLVELNDTCVLRIAPFADGGCGYKITNPANPDEYYIIENRQPKGWDDKICTKGRGLQVTHVDYSISRWNSNTVNTDPNHQRMTIIAANDKYAGTNSAKDSDEWNETLRGNLFPYILPSQSLTDKTTPASIVYAGQFMGQPLYDITQNEDGTVTVYFLQSKEEYDKATNLALHRLNGDESIEVYAMNGMHVCSCLPHELYRIRFHHGVYIVRTPDGSVRKVLLK